MILNAENSKSESGKAKKPFPKLAALAVLLFGGILTTGYFAYQYLIEKSAQSNYRSVSKEEMEFLLENVAPATLQHFSNNPKAKEELVNNIKNLFTFAGQAQKDGLTGDENVRSELENIRIETAATMYDREINKDKGEFPPFSFISEDRIKEFWEGSDRRREAEFEKFLDMKIKIFKETDPDGIAPEITEEQRKQAREHFAKTRIYAEEVKEKGKQLSEKFHRRLEAAIKLQQAQYLSRLYSQEVLAKKLEVTDEEVQKYILARPEIKTEEKDNIKEQIRKEKEKRILDEIKENNPVEVAENFEIPKVSEEQLKEMQQSQMKTMPEANETKPKATP